MGEWIEASNLSRARSHQETAALAARIFRSRAALTTRVTPRNGNTCARTLFVRHWLYGPTNGRTKVNLCLSIGHKSFAADTAASTPESLRAIGLYPVRVVSTDDPLNALE